MEKKWKRMKQSEISLTEFKKSYHISSLLHIQTDRQTDRETVLNTHTHTHYRNYWFEEEKLSLCTIHTLRILLLLLYYHYHYS